MALGKQNMAFVGAVKTTHTLFPEKYVEGIMQPLAAGARIVPEGTVEGIPLLAIGYKYNRRKGL